MCSFFFFKQKTAYEMRISDWSSDVCSSDLTGPPAKDPGEIHVAQRVLPSRSCRHACPPITIERGERPSPARRQRAQWRNRQNQVPPPALSSAQPDFHLVLSYRAAILSLMRGDDMQMPRSEEHTSELQSQMRTS